MPPDPMGNLQNAEQKMLNTECRTQNAGRKKKITNLVIFLKTKNT